MVFLIVTAIYRSYTSVLGKTKLKGYLLIMNWDSSRDDSVLDQFSPHNGCVSSFKKLFRGN